MKIIAITLAAIVAISGAAGMAHATGNDNGCKKSGNSYVCDPGDGNQYEYTTATSSAQAAAMLNAYLNNQQAQGQVQGQGQIANGGAGGQGGEGGQGGNAEATAEGGNALSVATNGGNRVTISNPKQPKFTSSANLNFDLGLNATILQGVEHSNAKIVADWFADHGKPCLGMQVMLNTPQGRKLGVQADCTGQVVSK